MSCPEDRTVAFLLGELDEEEERAFDAHLLECESCWRAVQEDRAGRLALESVRAPAPVGLADRVALAVSLHGDEAPAAPRRADRPSRHRLRTRAVVTLATALAILAGALCSIELSRPAPAEAPQLTAVVRMLGPQVLEAPRLRAGEHFDIGGQAFVVRAVDFGGHPGLLAVSEQPFPMPHTMQLLRGSSEHAWMATDGAAALYGVNGRAGKRSVLVVADVPIAVLPEMAAHYHLI